MNFLPVLTYHSIDDSGSVISIAPRIFRRQMAFLAEHRFRVLPLTEAVACLTEARPFPKRAVAITFDDGLQNNYTEAFPCLREHGFPATVFAIAGRVGGDNNWQGQPASIPRLPLLSWAEMEEMNQNGIAFGAHTMRHLPLTLLSPADAEAEIRDSQNLLEQRLQTPVRHFAFPYGAYNEELKQIADSRFDATFSARLALISGQSERSDLERVDVYYLRSLPRFGFLRSLPLLKRYLAGRNALRNLRAALPGTQPFADITAERESA